MLLIRNCCSEHAATIHALRSYEAAILRVTRPGRSYRGRAAEVGRATQERADWIVHEYSRVARTLGMDADVRGIVI